MEGPAPVTDVIDVIDTSACADGQEDFFAQGLLELRKVEGGFTLVAQHFEYGGTAFFGHLDTATFNIHDMHLQRLDQKVPVIAAVRTSQRHARLPTPLKGRKLL